MARFSMVFRVFRGYILADTRHTFLNSQGYSGVHSQARSLKNRGPIFKDYAPALPE